MGYTTDFEGRFDSNKPFGDKMKAYLKLFFETRRMKRNVDEAFGVEGEFYVFGGGSYGQAHEDNVIDSNNSASTQPGLWCKWEVTEDGQGIQWSGAEKFYAYSEWLVYLIHKILAPNGYVLNGTMTWDGEETGDVGEIFIEDNRVYTQEWKGHKEEHTPENCKAYHYGIGETSNFMRTDVVLILEEDGRELKPFDQLLLPESTEAKVEFTNILLAENVSMDFGGDTIEVDVYRNEKGNIEIVISDEDMQKYTPLGTCTEGYNDEVIVYPFRG